MPEYLAPGVYVEEIERGPRPIEGVATSTAAFVGETVRGPLKPRLVTNYAAYTRLYGGVLDGGRYMAHAARSFFENGGRRCYIARVAGDNALSSTLNSGGFTFTAVGPGSAGDRIWVRVSRGSTLDSAGDPVGFRLQVFYFDDGTPFDAGDSANDNRLPRPAVTEDYDDLRLEPSHPDYYAKRVNNENSSLIELEVAAGTPLPADPANPAISETLQNGDDGDPVTAVNFGGANDDPSLRSGLAALDLDPYRDVAIVYAPAVDADVRDRVITHCERNRYRIAVIDSDSGVGNPTNLTPRTERDSQYAAFYYPWIETSDPETGERIEIPPGGAVCGIYARSDNTRGVWKAPANEVVRGALDLEYDIDHGTQEVLNPRGVNVIRRFPGRGIRVWGARTLSSNTLWKYVSVRRLFIFLEASIYRSTQWVVFEPNDSRLWARVQQSVTLFLRTQWREGALLGAKEEEAFSVRVGRGETMTEDDILNGRLIVEIGIAPVRPAEFVIFRVFQKTVESQS